MVSGVVVFAVLSIAFFSAMHLEFVRFGVHPATHPCCLLTLIWEAPLPCLHPPFHRCRMRLVFHWLGSQSRENLSPAL